MKKVGIIGGIGPVATLDYYTGIIRGVRERTGDDNYPELVINSINITKMLSLISNNNLEALIEMLLNSIKALADAGVDFAAIASNTPHIVFDRVKEKSMLPLISVVDATCEYAKSRRVKKAIIIGTRFTMSSSLYSEALENYNISIVVPSDNEQIIIQNIIFPKLVDGIVAPEDKHKMLEIIERLRIEHSADALILGCTELPLMIQNNDVNIEVLNTTQIHIDAIVNSICCSE